MGPPIGFWPYSYNTPDYSDKSDTHESGNSENPIRNCLVYRVVDNFRLTCLHLTVILVILQILFSLNSVAAGPVILNLDYMQGPVPLARNIRHLPCISRKTGQEGMCMFAIDCLKANGTHLGTCIDRFYFGSCCQIPDKTVLPQIIGNNIDDNSIDSSSFVHPQTEDNTHSTVSRIPDIFPTKKPVIIEENTTKKSEIEISSTVQETSKTPVILEDSTTKKAEMEITSTVQEKYDAESPEMKTDDATTIDNKIPNDEEKVKITTAMVVESSTKKLTVDVTTKLPQVTTEVPLKLSTFQTVSGDKINNIVSVTDEPFKSTLSDNTTATSETTTVKQTKPTSRPTYRPRPTYKPSNFTRPTYLSTRRPLPTKPISTIYNSTRKPPYRHPPKRPSTKKPLPSPPRLNITILPQSTSSRPVFTRPLTPIIQPITYINNTATTEEQKLSTVVEQLTTVSTTTVTTTTTETPTTTTEKLETTQSSTTSSTTSSTVVITETTENTVVTSDATINTTETSVVEPVKTTIQDEISTIVSEKETTRPIEIESNEITEQYDTTHEPSTVAFVESSTTTSTTTTTEQPTTSTAFPPFVTWSNNVEVTKTTEKIQTTVLEDKPTEKVPTTVSQDETWSPITPPDGWILISTVPPKPQTTTTSTTTTTTTEQPTEQPTTTETQQLTTTETLTVKPLLTTTFSEPESPETTQYIPETTVSEETTEKITTLSEQQTTTVKTEEEKTTTTIPTTVVSTTTQKSTVVSPTTTSESSSTESVIEFTVNVTMSPTIPEPTQTQGSQSQGSSTLSTFGTENVTEAAMQATTASGNGTTAGTSEIDQSTTASPMNTTAMPNVTAAPEFTTSEPVNMSDYKDVCGRRLWPQGRIVGGAKSGFGQWPWQISLRQYRTSTYLHKCGAALLNENWAITAAHCVEHVPPSELLVRLGEHDLANEDEPYGFAERRVQIVASHPHFDPATFEYDLALLRFYEPVTFQPNILPVCVPDTDEDFVGKTAFVTGWGRLYDEGPLPSVLQEVQVPVINNTACEAMYQAAGYNEHIPNIFICAGWRKGGSDSCEGDSGGPMVIQRDRDKRFVLSGVISWGIGCAEPNQPGVYTRISEFRDWINQILQF